MNSLDFCHFKSPFSHFHLKILGWLYLSCVFGTILKSL